LTLERYWRPAQGQPFSVDACAAWLAVQVLHPILSAQQWRDFLWGTPVQMWEYSSDTVEQLRCLLERLRTWNPDTN
jgi:hypothetical protein